MLKNLSNRRSLLALLSMVRQKENVVMVNTPAIRMTLLIPELKVN